MQAYNQAAPVVKDVTDTAAPYVKKGLDVANDVAAPVVKAAEPVVKVRSLTPPFLLSFKISSMQASAISLCVPFTIILHS